MKRLIDEADLKTVQVDLMVASNIHRSARLERTLKLVNGLLLGPPVEDLLELIAFAVQKLESIVPSECVSCSFGSGLQGVCSECLDRARLVGELGPTLRVLKAVL